MLEVVVTSVAEAKAAAAGGASSIEVVREFALGGLTPAFDLVQAIRDAVKIDVNVIIRPHARDFSYTREERDRILSDAAKLDALELSHLVVMGLTPASELDLDLLRLLTEAAPNTGISLHRALDVAVRPEAALNAAVGFATRVLSAGPAPSAWEGRTALGQWVQTYGEFYLFACGGGITEEQLPQLVRDVSADTYHVGSAARIDGVVNSEAVARLVKIVEWER